MASNTDFLGLLKKDPVADASDTFNIQTMLNENWDKIDGVFNSNPDNTDLPRNAFVPMCKVGSYDGNGNYGESSPCVIELGFVPDFVVVVSTAATENFESLKLFRTLSSCTITWEHTCVIAWGADRVSWYVTGNNAAGFQFNKSDTKYHYVVLGHKGAST